jgi:hypothetical protein
MRRSWEGRRDERSDGALESTIKAAYKEPHKPTIAARARELSDAAIRNKQTFMSYLWALLAAELDDRAERRRARWTREAKLPAETVGRFPIPGCKQIRAANINELGT